MSNPPSHCDVACVTLIMCLGSPDGASGHTANGRWHNANLPTPARNVQWRAHDAMVVRKINGADHILVAQAETRLKIGDLIKTGPACLMGVEFFLGGGLALRNGLTYEVVNERCIRDADPTLKKFVERKLEILHNVAHQNPTLQIQMSGGGGIKG